MRIRYDYLALLVGSLAFGAGCAELKEEGPPTGNDGSLKIHEAGWTDSASSNFHGRAIRAANWDMALCRQCHGADYAGGIVQVSCRTCHTQPAGPENCATCHGSANNPAPPVDIDRESSRSRHSVGAHQKHLQGGSLANPLICSDCHTVPTSLSSPGHIGPSPAEVPMNGARGRTVTNEPGTTDYDATLPLFTPDPVYAFDSLTCANTYCHGDFKNGNSAVMRWTDTTAAATACGTCHGDTTKATLAERARPKSPTHPSSLSCSGCHSGVVDASLKIVDKSKHMNGKLNVFGQERDF